MGDVVDLHKKPKREQLSWITCGCTPAGTEYLVQVIVRDNPIITALVCPNCESTLDVYNGVIVDA
jgi:hypothetical protein